MKSAQMDPAGLMACFFITLIQLLTCFVTLQSQTKFHKIFHYTLFQGGFLL